MRITRKQFLDLAGGGALGAATYSTFGFPRRAEARGANDTTSGELKESPYSYKATAVGFGGRMDIPFPDILDVQAATALPPSGGHGSAHAENYRYGQVEDAAYLPIVSFEAAHSEVFGSMNEKGEHETMATVTIEGLKIAGKGPDVAGVVTANKIVARFTSKQKVGSELAVRARESKFDNLRIRGQLVEPKLHDELLNCETYSSLEAHPGFEPEVLDRAGKRLALRHLDERRKGEPHQDVVLHTSIFQEPLDVKAPLKADKGGCRVVVPNFGTIYLGEYVITRDSRRLTMLRAVMGPNQAGELVMGYVEGNGHIP